MKEIFKEILKQNPVNTQKIILQLLFNTDEEIEVQRSRIQ